MSPSRRVGIFVVLLSMVVAVVSGLGLMGPSVWEIFRLSGDLYLKPDLEACAAAPEEWVFRNDAGVEAWPIDLQTGRSFHPNGPALDWFSGLRLWLGEDEPVRVRLTGPWGGTLLHRTGATGDCAALLVRWPIDAQRRWPVLLSTLATLGLTLLLAIATTALFAVRPLRRVEADVAQRAAFEEHVANVAHDLRTPLSSLQLRLEEASRAPERAADLIGPALEDVVYLGLLTENLTTASQLGRGALPGEQDLVDLTTLVQRVADRFSLLGDRRGVEVICARPDVSIQIRASSVYVEQLVANLIHNAVVHNERGGHVAVILEATATAFRLDVVDDGPGVAPDMLPRLTDRGFRGDPARRRDPRGGGLGLAIVQEIAERFGWEVVLKAEAPSGLRVSIRPRDPEVETTTHQSG